MTVQGFHQFDVWKKAMDLSVKVHDLTKNFPKNEQFELVSQMRTAALSVASNIAEGFGRYTYADKKHKYVQARGELIELMNYFYYAPRVGYAEKSVCEGFLLESQDVHRMLNALISKMDAMDAHGPKS